MSEQKLTDWFLGDVVPVRVGVYERLQNGKMLFWTWNGRFWEIGGWPYPCGVKQMNGQSMFQKLPWRGLSSDPSA